MREGHVEEEGVFRGRALLQEVVREILVLQRQRREVQRLLHHRDRGIALLVPVVIVGVVVAKRAKREPLRGQKLLRVRRKCHTANYRTQSKAA